VIGPFPFVSDAVLLAEPIVCSPVGWLPQLHTARN